MTEFKIRYVRVANNENLITGPEMESEQIYLLWTKFPLVESMTQSLDDAGLHHNEDHDELIRSCLGEVNAETGDDTSLHVVWCNAWKPLGLTREQAYELAALGEDS